MNEDINSKKMLKILICICAVVIIFTLIFIFFRLIKKDNKPVSNNNFAVNSLHENTSKSSNTNSNISLNSHELDPSEDIDQNSSDDTEYDKEGPFLMDVEDVFSIRNKGTVATGKIERGTIHLDDSVEIIGLEDEIKKVVVTGIEKNRNSVDLAEAGESVGLVFEDIEKEDVVRGQVIAEPDSIENVSKFDAEVYMLKKEEGGRHTPIFDGYRPQFYFRTTEINGVVNLPSDVEAVYLGDTANLNIELKSPVAMEVGTEFKILENGKLVGKGTVTNID